jgi:hypothetical protein
MTASATAQEIDNTAITFQTMTGLEAIIGSPSKINLSGYLRGEVGWIFLIGCERSP